MMTPKKAKDHCGYEPKPVFNTCGNCAAFAFDVALPAWMESQNRALIAGSFAPDFTVERHGVEKNLRCTDHGFATKKTATCTLWRAK